MQLVQGIHVTYQLPGKQLSQPVSLPACANNTLPDQALKASPNRPTKKDFSRHTCYRLQPASLPACGRNALPRLTKQVSQPVPPPASFCWSTGISEASENHSLFCPKDNSSINSTSSEAIEQKLQEI